MAQTARCRRACRETARGEGRQTDRRAGRDRASDSRACPGEQAVDHDRSRTGHHGKSTRSLGITVRESGSRRQAQQALTATWNELTEAGVTTPAASALTGLVRSTATRRRTATSTPTPACSSQATAVVPVNKLSEL